MYCENCGEKLSDNARFCPSCGQPVGEAQERTRILKREDAPARDVSKTVRLQRPAAAEQTSRSSATTAAGRSSTGAATGQTSDHEPARRTSPLVLILVAVAAIALIFAALYFIGTRAKAPSQPQGQESAATQPSDGQQPSEDAGTAAQDATDGGTSNQPEAAPQATGTPENTHAGGPQEDVDEDELAAWSSKARSLMNFYPVNHVLAGGGSDEPSPMSIDTWASNCLLYANADSAFGQALLNDPDSVAAPLGFYEVASYVSGTSVVSADANGVVVRVSIQGTQMDWSATTELTETFLVQFDDNSQVVNVTQLD